MGNKQGNPKYSFFGVLFGQMCQFKKFSKDAPAELIQTVDKSEFFLNKTYLITGASSGIGKDICQLLLSRGASVVMVSRSQHNLQQAKQQLLDILQNNQNIQQLQNKIQLEVSDLGDLESVQQLAHRLLEQKVKLDGLINNAGVLPVKQKITIFKQQEIEETFAVHVLAPFMLATLLLPCFNQAARIVNNTSAGAYSQKLDNLLIQSNFQQCVIKNNKNEKQEMDENKYKDGALVYAQCKRAQLELTSMFCQHSLPPHLLAYSVHPGWAKTPGLESLFEQQPSYKQFNFRPSIQAAYGIVYSIQDMQVANDLLYFDGQIQSKHRMWAGTRVSDKERLQLFNYCSKFIQQN